MLRSVVATSAGELESLRPEWERLYRTGDYTFFQSFSWNFLGARCFAHCESPCVVYVEDEAGAALVPAAVREDRIVLLGDALFDYRDVLAGGDPGLLRRAWGKLAGFGLPLEVTALAGTRALRAWEAMDFSPKRYAAAPRVLTDEISADEFAREHTRSARLLRRLARAGAEVRQHTGDESDLVRYIYRAKGEQFAGRPGNLFADHARVEFMIAAAALDPAACEIFTLETGSTLVAALVTFRDRRIRRFYTIYYDQRWAHYSPGVALVFEVTRRSLVDGLDSDYMTGEQPHKTRLATSRMALFRVHASAHNLRRLAQLPVPVPAAA